MSSDHGCLSFGVYCCGNGIVDKFASYFVGFSVRISSGISSGLIICPSVGSNTGESMRFGLKLCLS